MSNILKTILKPDKYSVELPLNMIVADNKVEEEWIQKIIADIRTGQKIKSIVVVKHPKKDFFAVLDGHHRYWAYKKLKFPKIKCAVINDIYGLGFYLTKKGIFQPDPRITKYIRIPIKRFNKFIVDFIKNPENMLNTQTVTKK